MTVAARLAEIRARLSSVSPLDDAGELLAEWDAAAEIGWARTLSPADASALLQEIYELRLERQDDRIDLRLLLAVAEAAEIVSKRRAKWAPVGTLPFPLATMLDRLDNALAALEAE